MGLGKHFTIPPQEHPSIIIHRKPFGFEPRPMFSENDCQLWSHGDPKIGDCATGTHIKIHAQDGQNVTCEDCAPGTLTDQINMDECKAWKTCGSGEYVSTAGTSTSEAACSPVTQCGPGTYLEKAAAATSDAKCTACAEGYYSTGTNVTACSKFQDCVTGQYVSTSGTRISDRMCATCPQDSYSTTNAASCSYYPSCREILRAEINRGNGTYKIDPDGIGGGAPIDVHCDMTNYGGGWTNMDFTTNLLYLAPNAQGVPIKVLCSGGLSETVNSITCLQPYFATDGSNVYDDALFRLKCNGNSPTTTEDHYVLTYMAPLLGHRDSITLGFATQTRNCGGTISVPAGTPEYCYYSSNPLVTGELRDTNSGQCGYSNDSTKDKSPTSDILNKFVLTL